MRAVFIEFSFNLFLEKKVAKIQENLTLPPTSLPRGAQNFPATALHPPKGEWYRGTANQRLQLKLQDFM